MIGLLVINKFAVTCNLLFRLTDTLVRKGQKLNIRGWVDGRGPVSGVSHL